MPVGISNITRQIVPNDYEFYCRQVHVLNKTTDRILKVALKSNDFRTRSAAAYVCGIRNKQHLREDLFELLVDNNVSINQSGRLALIILSAKHMKKGFVDFGPPSNATDEERFAAQELWQEWWTEIEESKSPGKK